LHPKAVGDEIHSMIAIPELINKQVVLEGLRLKFPGSDPYALGLAGMRALREQQESDGPDELLERVQVHLKHLENSPHTRVVQSR
jgi:hypothetical protein